MEFELSTEDGMAVDSLRRHVEAEVLPKVRPVWDQAVDFHRELTRVFHRELTHL